MARRAEIFDARFAKFLLVGLSNTLVGVGVIYLAKWWAGIDDITSNALGYGVGLAMSFALNKAWTFQFGGDSRVALARFLLVFVAAYLANLGTVLLFARTLEVNGYLAQLAGVLPYTLISYLGSRHFAFS
jgi:putative flippase GtrA